VTATQAGNANYSSSTGTSTVTIGKANPTITIPGLVLHVGDLVSIPITSTSGDTNFTFTSSGIYCTATTLGSTRFSYYVQGTLAGTCGVYATDPGNDYYNSWTAAQSITVINWDQTITFPTIAPTVVGSADFTLGATASSGLPVSYQFSGPCQPTAVLGTVHVNGTGTCTVTATQNGNNTYNAAPPVSQTFTISKGTVSIGTASVRYGQDVAVAVTTNTNSSLTWESLTPSTCKVYTNYAQYWIEGLYPGTCTVKATAVNNPLATGQQDFTIPKLSQTVTIQSGLVTGFGQDLVVPISSSSGLGVFVFTTTTPVCTASIVGGNPYEYWIHANMVGTCTVSATQPGNGLYDPATSPDTSISIGKSSQTITIGSKPMTQNQDVIIPVSSSSGLAIPDSGWASLTPTICTAYIDSGDHWVRGDNLGTCTVQATQDGDGNYASAAATSTFTIDPGQTVTIGSAPVAYGQDVSLPVSSSAGITPFTWTSLTPSTCTVYTVNASPVPAEYRVQGVRPGPCTVKADQAGNSKYAAASATLDITIGKANPTITIPSGLVLHVGDLVSIPITSTSADTNFTFTSSGIYCTAITAGSTSFTYSIQGTLAGTCWVSATDPGNDYYNSATATQSISVSKFDQTITFPQITKRVEGSPDFDPGATASSGLPVTYQVSSPCQLTSELNVVNVTGTGTCTITAFQTGDDTYNAATPVSQTLTIDPADVTIGSASVAYGQDVPVSVSSKADPTSYTLESLTPSTCWAHIDYGQYWIKGLYPGKCTVKATVVGNPLATVQQDFTVPKLDQKVTIQSGLVTSVGQDIIVPISSTSGLSPFEFTAAPPDICTASIVGGNPYEYLIHANSFGICTVSATQSGDGLYDPSPTATQSISIGKGSQTITIGSAPVTKGHDASIPVSSSAGLTIPDAGWVSLTEDTCSVSTVIASTGNTEYWVHGVGLGTCTVQATQDGNSDYAMATANRDLDIVEAQVVTIASAPVAYGQDVPFSASSSVGLAPFIWESPTPDTCTVSPAGVVHGVQLGKCTVTATQVGGYVGEIYYDWASATSTFDIDKANPTITVGQFPDEGTHDSGIVVHVGQSQGVPIVSTSGINDISVEVNNPDYCSISQDVRDYSVLGIRAGSCSISVSKPGNDLYNPVTSTWIITVSKFDQTITFPEIAPLVEGSPDFDPGATSSSGLPVTYQVSSPCQATNGTNIVHITVDGTCTITASQGGDDTYNAAAPVVRQVSITVPPAPALKPVIYDPTSPNMDLNLPLSDEAGTQYDLAPHFGSTPDFPFTYTAEGQCWVTGHMVYPTNPQFGSCYVTATAAPTPTDPLYPFYRSVSVTRVIEIGTGGENIANFAIGQIGNTGCNPNPGESLPTVKSLTPWDDSDAFTDTYLSSDGTPFWTRGERDPKANRYGDSCFGGEDYAWCTWFSLSVWQQAGVSQLPSDGTLWRAPGWQSWGIDHGQWAPQTDPAVGDVVVYASPGEPTGAHVAVVVEVYANGTYDVVGGNQSWQDPSGGPDKWYTAPYGRNTVTRVRNDAFGGGYYVLGFAQPFPSDSTVGLGQVGPNALGSNLAAAPALWLAPFSLWFTGRMSEIRRRSRRKVRTH
jgi:hypothetical protein